MDNPENTPKDELVSPESTNDVFSSLDRLKAALHKTDEAPASAEIPALEPRIASFAPAEEITPINVDRLRSMIKTKSEPKDEQSLTTILFEPSLADVEEAQCEADPVGVDGKKLTEIDLINDWGDPFAISDLEDTSKPSARIQSMVDALMKTQSAKSTDEIDLEALGPIGHKLKYLGLSSTAITQDDSESAEEFLRRGEFLCNQAIAKPVFLDGAIAFEINEDGQKLRAELIDDAISMAEMEVEQIQNSLKNKAEQISKLRGLKSSLMS